jgi:2,3-bisphosphoglycerate-independent phosphoglycerate mutase
MTTRAGMKLNSVKDVLEERAITAELTQDAWRKRLSMDVPLISEEEAADRVIRASKEHDLVLVEYYLTDKAGHSRDAKLAHSILTRMDRFLQHLDPGRQEHGYTLLLTSDHGNLEDLSVKTHTYNRVPLFVQVNGVPLSRSGIHPGYYSAVC